MPHTSTSTKVQKNKDIEGRAGRAPLQIAFWSGKYVISRLEVAPDDNQGHMSRVSLQSDCGSSLISPFYRGIKFLPRNFPNKYLENGQILRTYFLIPPKFHLIPPKFHLIPPKNLSIS